MRSLTVCVALACRAAAARVRDYQHLLSRRGSRKSGRRNEIGPGPGLHPHEVIAHGHPVEVVPQNLVLAECRLHPEAAADLHQSCDNNCGVRGR